MAIAETILGAVLNVVFDKLASTEVVSLLKRSKIDQSLVNKLKTLMLASEKFLEDAEEKQFTNHAVKGWLNELKHWFYRAEEVVDVISTECLRLSVEAEMPSEPESFVTKLRNLTPFSDSSNFAKKVSLEISEVVSMLESMLSQKEALGLRELSVSTALQSRGMPTTSLLEDPKVYGRDDDQKQIVDYLLSEEAEINEINVIAIVGMGGLGKTTLAKLVYNDDQNLGQRFDIKAWAYVSDQFDVFQVTKSILGASDSSDLNSLQLELRDKLKEKRFFIVLDDVWSDSFAEWELLCSPFHSGAQGSSIIVTTRNEAVVSTVRAASVFHLKILSDSDSWFLFCRHAFGVRTSGSKQKLEVIGKEILKKCGGLPLAIKTVASVLRCVQGINQWEAFLQSSIWNLRRTQSDVAPALWLSYYHLPSHLKRCFSFCAIFPKDYDLNRFEIVLLWMAEGLIVKPANDSRRIEDIGVEYFNQLVSWSFIEKMGDDNSKFVMHDLIHDLATEVSGDFITRLEHDSLPKLSGNTRHISFVSSGRDRVANFKDVRQSSYLQSFISFNKRRGSSHISMMVSTELLIHLSSLKVLSLPGYGNFMLPDCIGDLKLLREIDVSYSKIRKLPESISKLYNLKSLSLEKCTSLEKLPEDMCKLISLRHLNLRGTTSLQEMPKQISKLTSLQSLTDFVMGNDAAPGLEDLGKLLQLRGELSLRRLQNVTSPENALKANLSCKEYIDFVMMEFDAEENGDSENGRAVLEYLRPHLNLRTLFLTNYAGTRFPSWLDTGCIVYEKLAFLRLAGVRYCLSLPPLGVLQRLEELYIDGMDYMTKLGPEFYGHDQALGNPFPSLKTLHFENMSVWEEWSGDGVGEGGSRPFPCLKKLILIKCPRLKGKLPINFHSLKDYLIHECEQLPASLLELSNIRALKLSKPSEVEFEGTSLRSLRLSSLAAFYIEGHANLESLEDVVLPLNLREFRIEDCKALEYLPAKMGMLSHLKFFHVEKCPCLSSSSSGPGRTMPTSLEYLRVEDCERWEFPIEIESMHIYSFLVNVRLKGTCHSLEVFPLGIFPNLQNLSLYSCGGLKKVYVPDGISGSGSVSLRSLEIRDCPHLEILGKETSSGDAAIFPSIPILEWLTVEGCAKVRPVVFTSDGVDDDGVPTKLISLGIDYNGAAGGIACNWQPNTLLLRFSHLRNLTLKNQDVECFPDGGCLLKNLTDVGAAFYGHNQALTNSFPSLKTLHFENMSVWEKWLDDGAVESGRYPFPCLKKLSLKKCPRLKGKLPLNLYSLEELEISECKNLVGSLLDLSTIRELRLWKTPKVDIQSTLCFTSLRSMTLFGLDQLQDMLLNLAGLSSLTSLNIEECTTLKSVEAMVLPMSLKKIVIRKCEALEYVPAEMGKLSHLESFDVWKCPCLRSGPECTLPTSLENLTVIYCGSWEFPIAIERMHLYSSLVDVSLDGTCNSLEVFPLGIFPNLQELSVWSCGGLKKVYVPDGISSSGLVSLRSLEIRCCPNLEIVGKEMSSGDEAMFPCVPNLEELIVMGCEKVRPVVFTGDAVEGDGVHTKLKSLEIEYNGVEAGIACKWQPNTLLLRFPHLQHLILWNNQYVERFPDKGCLMLPKSLTILGVYDYEKLKKLDGEALMALTSLKELKIWDCPELECLPQQGLPHSLEHLEILGSPKVSDRCDKDKGVDWHLIRHIPFVDIRGAYVWGSNPTPTLEE